MADGLNQVRAMRVAEIIEDYRNLQNYISSIRANPNAEEYNEDGYVVLRRCVLEAQNLLAKPFISSPGSKGNAEQDKMNLRRIIVDASIRRFKAQKIYFRAVAAMHWINGRNQILQGGPAHAGHAQVLEHLRQLLRQELAAISDDHVYAVLEHQDRAAGKWLAEDPPLAVIQRVLDSEA